MNTKRQSTAARARARTRLGVRMRNSSAFLRQLRLSTPHHTGATWRADPLEPLWDGTCDDFDAVSMSCPIGKRRGRGQDRNAANKLYTACVRPPLVSALDHASHGAGSSSSDGACAGPHLALLHECGGPGQVCGEASIDPVASMSPVAPVPAALVVLHGTDTGIDGLFAALLGDADTDAGPGAEAAADTDAGSGKPVPNVDRTSCVDNESISQAPEEGLLACAVQEILSQPASVQGEGGEGWTIRLGAMAVPRAPGARTSSSAVSGASSEPQHLSWEWDDDGDGEGNGEDEVNSDGVAASGVRQQQQQWARVSDAAHAVSLVRTLRRRIARSVHSSSPHVILRCWCTRGIDVHHEEGQEQSDGHCGKPSYGILLTFALLCGDGDGGDDCAENDRDEPDDGLLALLAATAKLRDCSLGSRAATSTTTTAAATTAAAAAAAGCLSLSPLTLLLAPYLLGSAALAVVACIDPVRFELCKGSDSGGTEIVRREFDTAARRAAKQTLQFSLAFHGVRAVGLRYFPEQDELRHHGVLVELGMGLGIGRGHESSGGTCDSVDASACTGATLVQMPPQRSEHVQTAFTVSLRAASLLPRPAILEGGQFEGMPRAAPLVFAILSFGFQTMTTATVRAETVKAAKARVKLAGNTDGVSTGRSDDDTLWEVAWDAHFTVQTDKALHASMPLLRVEVWQWIEDGMADMAEMEESGAEYDYMRPRYGVPLAFAKVEAWSLLTKPESGGDGDAAVRSWPLLSLCPASASDADERDESSGNSSSGSDSEPGAEDHDWGSLSRSTLRDGSTHMGAIEMSVTLDYSAPPDEIEANTAVARVGGGDDQWHVALAGARTRQRERQRLRAQQRSAQRSAQRLSGIESVRWPTSSTINGHTPPQAAASMSTPCLPDTGTLPARRRLTYEQWSSGANADTVMAQKRAPPAHTPAAAAADTPVAAVSTSAPVILTPAPSMPLTGRAAVDERATNHSVITGSAKRNSDTKATRMAATIAAVRRQRARQRQAAVLRSERVVRARSFVRAQARADTHSRVPGAVHNRQTNSKGSSRSRVIRSGGGLGLS